MPPELDELLRARLTLDPSQLPGACPAGPPGMLDFARAGLGGPALRRKLVRRLELRNRVRHHDHHHHHREVVERGLQCPPGAPAPEAAAEPGLDEARHDLLGMVARIEQRVRTASTRFLLADQAIQARGVEGNDIDFEGGAGIGRGAEKVAEKTLAMRAYQVGDTIAAGAEFVLKLSPVVKVLLCVRETLTEAFDAKHSRAHRQATRQVLEATANDLAIWCERQRAGIAAAGSIDELRQQAQEILTLLGEARSEVAVIAELQAWVLRLETQGPSYSAAETIDHTRDDRAALGAALEEEEAVAPMLP